MRSAAPALAIRSGREDKRHQQCGGTATDRSSKSRIWLTPKRVLATVGLRCKVDCHNCSMSSLHLPTTCPAPAAIAAHTAPPALRHFLVKHAIVGIHCQVDVIQGTPPEGPVTGVVLGQPQAKNRVFELGQ